MYAVYIDAMFVEICMHENPLHENPLAVRSYSKSVLSFGLDT